MFRVGKNSRKEQLGCHEKDCSDQATVVTAKPWSATRTCEQHVCRRHQCPCVPERGGNFGWLTRTRSSSWRATMRPLEQDIWETAEVRHARICHGPAFFDADCRSQTRQRVFARGPTTVPMSSAKRSMPPRAVRGVGQQCDLPCDEIPKTVNTGARVSNTRYVVSNTALERRWYTSETTLRERLSLGLFHVCATPSAATLLCVARMGLCVPSLWDSLRQTTRGPVQGLPLDVACVLVP